MKKFTLLSLLILSCCCFQVRAQQYVTTEPTNRNVILEEFTGRGCGACPAGHFYANQCSASNPDRFWAINIHAGGYAHTTYPNFRTNDGTSIHNGFAISGYPAGTLNRYSTEGANYTPLIGGNGNGTMTPSVSTWIPLVSTILQQPSVANIGGKCIIDPNTRIATIKIEVYYTADGTTATIPENNPLSSNFVTIAMLQNNILGSQSGMASNPSQVVGNQYNHMHVLRDIITAPWGDEITNISEGSLVELTYIYEIPETIGSPNGVEVILEDLEFLVWLAETKYFIITANKLEVVFGSTEPINPIIKSLAQAEGVTCDDIKIVETNILNGGTESITSIEFELDVDGVVTTQVWEGEIPAYNTKEIELNVEANKAEQTLTLTILKVNGEDVEQNGSTTTQTTIISEDCVIIDDYVESIKINVRQDKYGSEISWKLFAADLSVIAEHQYTDIVLPAPVTKLHTHVIPLTTKGTKAFKFTIYDSKGNGFNTTFGAGEYWLEDDKGNTFFESDAKFTNFETVNFQVLYDPGVGIIDNNSELKIYPNPANDYIMISNIENVKAINIYDISGKAIFNTNNISNEINVSTFNSGVYFMKILFDDGTTVNEKFIKK